MELNKHQLIEGHRDDRAIVQQQFPLGLFQV